MYSRVAYNKEEAIEVLDLLHELAGLTMRQASRFKREIKDYRGDYNPYKRLPTYLDNQRSVLEMTIEKMNQMITKI